MGNNPTGYPFHFHLSLFCFPLSGHPTMLQGKTEHFCTKIHSMPYETRDYFCTNKKNEYDKRNQKTKNMAHVNSHLRNRSNLL